MLKIVIDARRIRDFGIGTYIRNLIQALAKVDQRNKYVLVASAADTPLLAGLPPQFEIATYNPSDDRASGNIEDEPPRVDERFGVRRKVAEASDEAAVDP